MLPVSGGHSFVRIDSAMVNQLEVHMLIILAIVLAAFAISFLVARMADLYPARRDVTKSKTYYSTKKGQNRKSIAGASSRGSHRKTPVIYKTAAHNKEAIKAPWGW
jgi:Na+/citrate or Na+/malate symporter